MASIENGIIKGPINDGEIHEKGLGWHIFECMQENKDNIAQICAETGVKETFGDVLQRAIRTALELKRQGVTSSDIIATCTFNHLNSCVPVLASIFLNCKTVSLDPSISLPDTIQLIGQVKPKVIFIDKDSEEFISKVQKSVDFKFKIVSFALSDSSNFEWFGNFIKPSENGKEEEEFRPTVAENLRETILIFFSSGSTGLPKGICLHHYGMMKQFKLKNSNFIKIEDMGLFVSFSSNYWISSFQVLYGSVQLGFTRLIVKKYKPKVFWNLIDVHQPRVAFAAPCQLLETLEGKGVPEGVNNSLKLIYFGGQGINSDLLKFVREKMPTTLINLAYGQTEACGIVSAFDLTSPEGLAKMYERLASCGTATRGNSYKVIDIDTGKLCGPNEKGELYLKSECLMNGYYNRDSSKEFDEEGWLKTGDVVYYDEDLYFYIVDRTKEMLKYKSWHVVPAKLESALCAHPDVFNAVVIGKPDPLDGDHPCGIVKLKKGATATADEIRKFADEQLDERQKLRGGVHIIEDFPLTPTGKINKRQIKAMFLPSQ